MRADETVTAGQEDRGATPVLSFREVSKAFGPTLAVDGVSFDLEAGEVHALVGENGAGKSTLIRILAGDHQPDSGKIVLNGETVRFAHPGAALEHGVGFVHQIPTFVPGLSVTENLLLGVPFEHRRAGLIDWKAEHRAAGEDLRRVGLSLNPRLPVERLGADERQLVAVARAMKRGLRILVLDEVTASLSEPEVRILHDQVRRLREQGVSIIYVSHRLEEVFRLADRVTVMRDGRRVATLRVAGLTQKDVVKHIVGADLDDLFAKKAPDTAPRVGRPRLGVRGLSDAKLTDISFDVFAGEILGVCGLGGSGRSRLLRMIYGVQPIGTGTIEVEGEAQKFRDAADALAAGVGLVTEDRIADGFVATLPIWQNVTLPWSSRFTRHGMLRLDEEREAARANAVRLGVRMPGITALMTQLSGGNQQKALFARWLTGPLRVLLLDEPTHGVDIRSKGQIYEIIRRLADDGLAIVLVSSELEEFETLCDRVLLLRDGRISGERRGAEISKDILLHNLLARATVH